MEPYIHPLLVGSFQAPQAKKLLVQMLISGRLGAPLRSARKRLSHAAAAAGALGKHERGHVMLLLRKRKLKLSDNLCKGESCCPKPSKESSCPKPKKARAN